MKAIIRGVKQQSLHLKNIQSLKDRAKNLNKTEGRVLNKAPTARHLFIKSPQDEKKETGAFSDNQNDVRDSQRGLGQKE